MFDFFYHIFSNHPSLLFFIASFLGGEELILILAFLAAHKIFNLGNIFIFCFLGTLISDICWFLFGGFLSKKVEFFRNALSKYKHLFNIIKKISDKNYIVLLISKFIYGVRITTIMYFGAHNLNLIRFVLYEIFVICVWLPIVLLLGWFAGKGVSFFVNIYDNVWIMFVIVVSFIIGISFLKKYLNKEIDKIDKI